MERRDGIADISRGAVSKHPMVLWLFVRLLSLTNIGRAGQDLIDLSNNGLPMSSMWVVYLTQDLVQDNTGAQTIPVKYHFISIYACNPNYNLQYFDGLAPHHVACEQYPHPQYTGLLQGQCHMARWSICIGSLSNNILKASVVPCRAAT